MQTGEEGDGPMAKAVRKMVRAIIEQEVGAGKAEEEVKKNMQRCYKKGVVWWNGPRVAEWDAEGGVLKFLREGEKLKEAHTRLLQTE